ncbi:MAG: alanine racemase, partial [SAR324 cluster bacterium]|nr:alanine racemase [SAR324 cluster bacterium]
MSKIREFPPLTRADINLTALAHNYRELRRLATPSAKIMAVVKADGYGHGALSVSETALANGADWLAVARICEVVQLREGGIIAPLLLFGLCFPEYVAYLAENNARASVNSLFSARLLAEEANRLGVRLKVHIKVDTGMGRLGAVACEMKRTVTSILQMAALPHLEIEGLYTHFASADSANKDSARKQLDLFLELLAELKRHQFDVPLVHAANSAATIELPASHLGMVRPGIAQYGLWPSEESDRHLIDLKPVMSLKSRIIQLKEVPAGFKISYGSTYETAAPTRIATVPVGYADGYNRLLSSRGVMLVHGLRVPVVGRVCMDLTMLDVGQVDGVEIGDEV